MRSAVLLLLVGCVVGVGSVEETDDGSEVVSLTASADSFGCVRPESPSTTNGGYSCSGSPSLVYSTLCAENASYHVSLVASAPDMTMAVLAPHGVPLVPATKGRRTPPTSRRSKPKPGPPAGCSVSCHCMRNYTREYDFLDFDQRIHAPDD